MKQSDADDERNQRREDEADELLEAFVEVERVKRRESLCSIFLSVWESIIDAMPSQAMENPRDDIPTAPSRRAPYEGFRSRLTP